jgi:hypothetical protein
MSGYIITIVYMIVNQIMKKFKLVSFTYFHRIKYMVYDGLWGLLTIMVKWINLKPNSSQTK